MQIEKLIQPYIKLEKCQTTKDYALAFARSGIPVIPLYTAMSGVCSCGIMPDQDSCQTAS